MFSGPYMIMMLIGGAFMLIGMVVQGRLKSKFKYYSQLPTTSGLSGKEIAEKMLSDYGITDVQVISARGQLTDHYNPTNKTVNLSEVVYNERNIAAAAVAAHEVGHAVQHATAYAWLGLRSKLVPMVNVASRIQQFVLMIALGITAATQFGLPLIIAIALVGVTTLFSVITLPVEFDASSRALAWLENSGVTATKETAGAKDALKWAAMTYVVAAMGSLAQLLFLIARFASRR